LSNLGTTTCFSSRRKAPRPAGQPPHDSAEIAWRLLDESFSLERAWSEINDAPARAAASTVEALMYSLRAGGAALASPHTRRRLSELNEAQLHEVSARLQKFQPNIARAWTPVEVELLVAVWSDLHG